MKVFKKEEGSITIEAALMIPIFLSFILLLTAFVKIGIAEITLQKAVNETVQSSAHYAYFGVAIQGLIDDAGDRFVGALTDNAKGAMDNNTVAEYIVDKLAGEAKGEIPTSGDIANQFSDGVYETLIRDKYITYVPASSTFFNPGGIHVTNSSYPKGKSGDSADVFIEVENTLKIILPFFEKEIKIKKVGVERGWVGD